MFQRVNQLNVSITTNRTCTLKCNHCYIEPELFKDKTQMTQEVFLSIFDQVKTLLMLDKRLEVVEWEAIGGETTMMPYEWWEEMLPIALAKIEEINKLTKKKGGLNFLSNLIYKDKRYTDLFRKYRDHPLFYLYTSYEPDTNRFGHNDKMYPKFIQTLRDIDSKRVILDLILTKTLVSIPPAKIISEFTALGVNDFSIKMLSPFGSGKAFFKDHMTNFELMSKWLSEFRAESNGVLVGGKQIKFTPTNEMEGALWDNSAFQCNGGFKYDLSIEPDGETHFNANQTGDEKVEGFSKIHISDPLWAIKTLFENKPEENRKFHSTNNYCYTCEYFRHCCGGWYHYRSAPFEQIEQYSQNECQGLSALWDETKGVIGTVGDFSGMNFSESLLNEPATQPNGQKKLLESEAKDNYEGYLNDVLSHNAVIVTPETVDRDIFGKCLFERVSAYNDLSKEVIIEALPSGHSGAQLVFHVLARNLTSVKIDSSLIFDFIKRHLHIPKVNLLAQLVDVVLQGSASQNHLHKLNPIPLVQVDTVDHRYDEILRSLLSRYVTDLNTFSHSSSYLNELAKQEELLRNAIKSQ